MLKETWRRADLLQIIPTLVLLCIGLLFIYSTGQQVGGNTPTAFFKKQLLFAGIGLCAWLFIALSDYRYLKHLSWLLYPFTLVLLVLVFFIGVKVYGARRWLDFGGIRLQPAELAKFAVLFLSATVLTIRGFDINKLSSILLLGLIGGVPFLLIMRQPDLGSSLVLLPLMASLILTARLRYKYIIIGLLFVMIAVPSAYPFLKDYQKERIMAFLDPDHDPKGSGWNQLQAELAVGSGGLWGKGYMQGTQNTLGFLPQTVSNTDFIFSVIAEETGFAGSLLVVSMYAMLVLSACRTAVFACDSFGRYIAIGIAAIFFTHSIINIGMSVRLMPVTGVPLPLISYGGTFLLSTMVALGILQSVYAHGRAVRASEPSLAPQ
ncbi:MAG: rod shape-determining protein RodA [Lentisphaerae bacterium GWF2_52_8]|nr:MAG: rod shape-determining protein RodA [Lentisphaerae bacterium GWF2_52_8]